MFKVKTLKNKISLVYMNLVFLIALVGGISAVNLYNLSGATDGLMKNNYKSITALNNMLEAIERQDSALLTYISIDRQKGISEYNDNLNVFYKWYYIEANNITEKQEDIYVNRIYNDYATYTKYFSMLQHINDAQSHDKAVDFYNKFITPNFIKLKKDMRDLSLINERAMFSGKDQAADNAKTSTFLVLMLSTSAVLAGIFFSRHFIKKFLSPVNNLTQAVKLIKEGQLDSRLEITSEDEFSELATEFNNMISRLNQYEKSNLGILLSEKNKSPAIVKSIADPLIVLDKNNRIILMNDACERFFSINEEKVLNKHFLEAIRNGEVFDHISLVYDARMDSIEKIIHIRSDKEYYFNVVVTRVKDAYENLTGIIVAFQDVTQLKKLERAKNDFVATISHEFKTPLTSVIMGTSMILDETMGELNEDQRDVMNTIREDELRLSNLVNDLLELSKVESYRAIFNIEACAIIDIVETSVMQFSETAESKGINLHYMLDETLPKVMADFERITWVLNNLISNALKYTKFGDEIFISAGLNKDRLMIFIKDTGKGIPKEFLGKVFDKFFQVNETDKDYNGSGLGLSIVKEIIEAHNGKIWCESDLNQGSTFIFTLPAITKEDYNEKSFSS